jgi:Sec-independent protein secretion pathway component TatC
MPEFVDPTLGANDYLDGPKMEMESIDQAPMVQESDSPSPVTPAIDAAEDQPSILKAWIMWGIPVLLMFFGIGFLLNFGLHWYYLGKMRRASKSTYIWSLTLSATLVAAVLNWLELSILAALVGIFVLLPLVAIQLIRVIKDASLLNKMAKRAARNPFKAKPRSA